jgi:hypothetical protein
LKKVTGTAEAKSKNKGKSKTFNTEDTEGAEELRRDWKLVIERKGNNKEVKRKAKS